MTRKRRIGKLVERLREIVTDLDQLRDEVQEGYDNMNEGLQQTPNGRRAEELIDELESASADAENAASQLESSV